MTSGSFSIRRQWRQRPSSTEWPRATPGSWSAGRRRPSMCSLALRVRRISGSLPQASRNSSRGRSKNLGRDRTMKTTAAVLLEAGKPFELMELDLDGPGPGEVLIKYIAAGLCHSDLHLTDGDLPPRFPIVGGHEGSGIIEEVGFGVTKVKPGDHVVCSFIPSCGTCRYCSTGRQNLCDMGATILEGCMPDG